MSKKDFVSLINRLKLIPVDSDINYFQLTQYELKLILGYFLTSEITQNELEECIDLLESNDGISFESNQLKEYVHLLSNHRINWSKFINQCSQIYNQI